MNETDAAEAPRVLIAYDGSPTAATAVRAVAGLFPGAHALIATVPSDPTVHSATTFPMLASTSADVVQLALDGMLAAARQEADETAAPAVEQARALGLDAEPAMIQPSPTAWAALLDTAHRLRADVLVCGTRGRGAFTRAFLGSTSSSLLHRTDVPLLVVPDGGGALDGPVVAAWDGSDGAKRAVQVAGRLLGDRPTVVVHGWEPVFHRGLAARALAGRGVDEMRDVVEGLHEQTAARAAATTEDGVALARDAGLDATGETVELHDGAWRAVAAAARTHGASLVVLGSRGLGAARSALLGSVSSSLVQNAELPVLVVPAESAEAPA